MKELFVLGLIIVTIILHVAITVAPFIIGAGFIYWLFF